MKPKKDTKKKIKVWVKCAWCDGLGYIIGSWKPEICDMCGGTGGHWEER